MRTSALLPALLIAASAGAQTVNTQLDGFTFTNGLTTLTDTSALYNGPDTSTGVTYLTDNDLYTYNTNISAADGGSLQGTFAGTISSSATGIYIVGLSFGGNTINGAFDVQLQLANGLTSALTYNDSNFVSTDTTVGNISYYQNGNGTIQLNDTQAGSGNFALLSIAFADFGVTGNQVIGIRLSNMESPYPDIAYIGAGYAGAPVPEPSTYGLILGGLALAGAAVRRRKISK